MDGRPNALVSSAAANIPCHLLIDVAVARMRFRGEQGNCLHDLSRLAVSALRNIHLLPGLLHCVRPMSRDTLNRSDLRTFHLAHLRGARAHGLAILQHRARAAERHPASKFRSRHSKNVAQIPQQRHLRIAVKTSCLAIHFEMNHGALPDLELKSMLILTPPGMAASRKTIQAALAFKPRSLRPEISNRFTSPNEC